MRTLCRILAVTMRACLALVMVVGHAAAARADGETSPMVGIVGIAGDIARPSVQDEPVGGVALDVAWWHGPIGIGGEASERWSLQNDGARATVLGASARLRIYRVLMPSLLDPRDVELGIELQGIVERAWWNAAAAGADPVAYGGGLAVRLRGGGDADGSILLAESRLFVRVMSSRWAVSDAIARSTSPAPMTERAVTVLFGLGASWGSGTPSYVHKFRLHPFQPTLLW